MDITKLYTRNGSVMAAHLVDNDESYPVLFDALRNDVIFPSLLKSGWVLTALPFSISKNGVDIMSLPKEVWTDELERKYGQDMYDMLGTPIPMDELRKHLHTSTASASFKEQQSYRFNTREEFLAYLDSIQDGVPDNDFLPLNVLVHPSARLSIGEYIKDNKYADLINSRRKFTYTRYTRLCEFLKQHGMPENFTDVDFLRAYMQWGVDGLQFEYKGKPDICKVHNAVDYSMEYSDVTRGMEPREITTYATRIVYALCVRTQQGYEVIPPKGYTKDQLFDAEHLPRYDYEIPDPRTHFHLTMDEEQAMQTMAPGEAIAVKRKVVYPRHQWECQVLDNVGFITCAFDAFRMGAAMVAPGFSISTPSGSPMPSSLIGDADDIRVSGFTMAIAQMIADKRRTNTDASLYKALRVNGYDDYSALMYYIATNGYYSDTDPAIMTGDSGVDYEIVLTSSMVSTYLRARADMEHYDEIMETMPVYVSNPEGNREELISMVADMFGGFLDGTLNNQRFDDAMREESTINAMRYYHSLRAVTLCTDTTVDEVYVQVKQWEPGNPIIINFPGGHLSLQGSKFDRVQREYDNQVRITRYEHVTNAPFFVWVDGAVKEFGDRRNDKHIGFYATVLEAGKKGAQEALEAFADFYASKVMEDIAPLRTADPMRYERLAFNFLHTPGMTVLPDGATADTPLGASVRRNGVARFFAAAMLMQAIKQSIFRLNTPAHKNEICYLKDYPDLQAKVDKARKCLVANGQMLFCDTKSFCDHIIDDSPFSLAQFFYTVNAVVDTDFVHPRVNFTIPVYDPACCFWYTAIQDAVSQGVLSVEFSPRDQFFYRKAEMRFDGDGMRDLLYATINRESTKSNFYDYMWTCNGLARAWKEEGSTTRLAGFTGTETMPDVEPIDSMEPVTDPKGVPCFNPGGWDSYQIGYDPGSIVVQAPVRDIHIFNGVSCEEYAAGVSTFEPPIQLGHTGMLTIIGNSIYASIYGKDEVHELNPADIANLSQDVYPVRHLYGSKYVFRTMDGNLYYVEV